MIRSDSHLEWIAPPRSQPMRAGSVYLLALFVTAILTTVGLTSIAILTRTRATSITRNDASKARTLLASGIDLAAHRVRIDPNWRTTYSSTPIVDSVRIGSGSVTVIASAIDASPNSDIGLLAEATVSEATQLASLTLQSQAIGMDALNSAMHVSGSIVFSDAIVYADAKITSNGAVAAATSEIDAPIEAVGTITGMDYLNTTTPGSPLIAFPDPSLIDTFASAAVLIPYAALPSGRIENMLLSPSSQPFTSETHPDGLYVIDCDGNSITLRSCRIVGTLVLLNVGDSSIIEDCVLIEPARSDYPSLLVQGSITIRMDRVMLSESLANTNFNPPSTPFEGVFDSLIDDRYPSEIRGVVYVTDTLSTRTRAVFQGAVFAAEVDCRNSLSIRHDARLQDNPPVGFVTQDRYTFVPGTWIKTVR